MEQVVLICSGHAYELYNIVRLASSVLSDVREGLNDCFKMDYSLESADRVIIK